MKKNTVLLLIIITSGFRLFAQYEYRGAEYYSYDEDVTIYLEADYDSRKSNNKNNYIYRLLKVYGNTESGRTQLINKLLTDECGKGFSYYLGDVFDTNTKKMVLIIGKYCFYVYDIKNNYLSGPHKPYFWGEAVDSQSGMIKELKISKDGDNVYGIIVDSGTFLFNTSDLKNVKERLPLNMPFFSTSRLFEIQTNRFKNSYDVVYVCEFDGLPKYNVLLSLQNLVPKTNLNILQLNEDEIEEIIMETEMSESRYSVIEEIITKNKRKFTVVDIITGKIIDLPENMKFTDEKKIREYLKTL